MTRLVGHLCANKHHNPLSYYDYIQQNIRRYTLSVQIILPIMGERKHGPVHPASMGPTRVTVKYSDAATERWRRLWEWLLAAPVEDLSGSSDSRADTIPMEADEESR